jgi:CRP-like cAMP-binding protein
VCTDIASTGNGGFATYAVRYWLERPQSRTSTGSRVRARIYAALKRADIPLAVPATANLVEVHDQARKERRIERETHTHLAALRTVHLFANLTEDELRTLAGGMMHVGFTAGETIMRQGAVAHSLFVMTSGTADVIVRYDPDGPGPAPAQTGLVATLTAPDFFGEMGLMTGEPRRADVVAKTDVECFRLPKEVFNQIVQARPELAEEISAKLASRQMQLAAVREGLDERSKAAREARERDRIAASIKQFFGLSR